MIIINDNTFPLTGRETNYLTKSSLDALGNPLMLCNLQPLRCPFGSINNFSLDIIRFIHPSMLSNLWLVVAISVQNRLFDSIGNSMFLYCFSIPKSCKCMEVWFFVHLQPLVDSVWLSFLRERALTILCAFIAWYPYT